METRVIAEIRQHKASLEKALGETSPEETVVDIVSSLDTIKINIEILIKCQICIF